MKIDIIPTQESLPVKRAHVLSMVIKTFKGRRDVEIHLFRADTDETEFEQYDWDELIEDTHHPDVPRDFEATRGFLKEAFTEEERDQVVEYLKERYTDRLESITGCPLSFPVPLGVTALSSIPEGKTMGFIRFEAVPNYTLPFTVHGYYDLAQHQPMAQE